MGNFQAAYEQAGHAEKNGHKPGTFTAAELLAMELPAPRWAIPDLLPEGVTLLAGKPKLGKSWMSLGMAVAVASGGMALGTKPVEQGEALYLGLEDSHRRLQKRLRKILQGEPAPPGLHFHVDWRRMDDGGIDDLHEWLSEHPECRLVIVDTLVRFKPHASGRRSQYDEDRASVDPLGPLAAEHGVALVPVYHLREMESDDPLDMIHGGAGLTGGVDGALILKRKRGRADAFLTADGRDLEEPKEYALNWDSELAAWRIAGDAEEYRISEQRRAILQKLADTDEPLGPKDLAEMLDAKYGPTRETLSQMAKDGQVKTLGRGQYVHPDNASDYPQKHPDNADNLTRKKEEEAPWGSLKI